jgi:EmrB/QacA subfamily drug resistance transporter
VATLPQGEDVGGTSALGRPTLLAMGAMGLATFVIANDFTTFSVALPAMERDLHADLSTMQWVINAYAVVFGVAIVTGGRIADIVGRRRVFFIGSAIFAVFSLAGAFATGAEWLIACRALMGIGGALMWPAVMGMTFDLLPAEKAGLAGGLILGAAGFGNAMGPLVGGLLTTYASWRWILLLNLPIAAVAVVATALVIKPDAAREGGEHLDYLGVGTLTIGLVSLLLALDVSSDVGWAAPGVLALLAASGAGFVGFALAQRRRLEDNLLPPDVLANRPFRWICLSVLLMSGVFFAILLYVPQFLIRPLGWSALAAGAGLLPMMLTFAVTSFVAGPLYNRLGARVTAGAGAACLTIGIFSLSFLYPDTTYAWLIPRLAVTGIGVGLFYSAVSTAGVTSLDLSRASLAGGIVYMCQVGGGSVGLAINTAVWSPPAAPPPS